MIIKKIGIGELEPIFQIVQSCQKHLSSLAQLNWDRQSLTDSLRDGNTLGCYDNGSLIGFILYLTLDQGHASQVEAESKRRDSEDTEAHSENNSDYKYGSDPKGGGSESDSRRDGASLFEVECLATFPEYQRRGVMSLLLQRLKMQANEIWLEVHEHNEKAISFYKYQEFQQVGLRKRYYSDGGNAVLFSWKKTSL